MDKLLDIARANEASVRFAPPILQEIDPIEQSPKVDAASGSNLEERLANWGSD